MDSTARTWTGHVFIGVSLDGFIARPDGDLDWLTDPRPGPRHMPVTTDRPVADYDSFYSGIDQIVMGRGTYEKILTFDQWPYPDRPIIVLSTTMSVDDRVAVARNLDEVLGLLSERHARHVYVDGGQVIRSFLRAGLIDWIDIAWAPVLIGSGLPLFGALDDDVQLSLTASSVRDDGMVQASYRVHRDQDADAPGADHMSR